MKKILSCLIAVLMLFISAGCGSFEVPSIKVNYFYNDSNLFEFTNWYSGDEDGTFTITEKSGITNVNFVKKEKASSNSNVESRVKGALSVFKYISFSVKSSYEMVISVSLTSLDGQESVLEGVNITIGTQFKTYTVQLDSELSDELDETERITITPRPGESGTSILGLLQISKAYFSTTLPQGGVLVGNDDDDNDNDDDDDDDDDDDQNSNIPLDKLWGVYNDYFPLGFAVGYDNLNRYKSNPASANLMSHFNSMVAENEMKMQELQGQQGNFNFTKSDQMIAYAKSQGMMVRGHTLVWYNYAPTWFYSGSKETTLNNLKTHINTVVKHYGDDVYAWDVVNEAISDNGGEVYRNDGKFYSKCGSDFIEVAFRAAREANPNIKLFYNDYSIEWADKRNRTLTMLNEMLAKGVPIDGVGMQCHVDVESFNAVQMEESIVAFANLGLEVQITELEVSIYNYNYNGAAKPMTDELRQKQAQVYKKIFEIARKHSTKITGVTLWGLADDYSWLDSYPVNNRKNYPLLFDASYNPKPAFNAIFNF